MKVIIASLIVLFLVLQYQLWFAADGSLHSIAHLRHDIKKQVRLNAKLKKRNDRLTADIKELKHGKHALGERARNDVGMIKKDETFYQVIKRGNDSNP